MLTVQDLYTSSGKYPERAKSKELTAEVMSNAGKLIDLVNKLLKDLGIDKVSVSSGFRPSTVNSAIPNAAKKSSHMICLAVDLVDNDGKLDEVFSKHPELLRKYGLFLEDPASTVGWAHVDCAIRADRPSRIFKP